MHPRIPLRPRPVPASAARTRPVPAGRRPRPVAPPAVEWDQSRDLYIGDCSNCCTSITLPLLEDAHEWAESHHCDPELISLFADVLRPLRRTRRAA